VCEGLKVKIKIKIKIKIKKIKEAHSTTFVSISVFPQLFISLLLKKKPQLGVSNGCSEEGRVEILLFIYLLENLNSEVVLVGHDDFVVVGDEDARGPVELARVNARFAKRVEELALGRKDGDSVISVCFVFFG